MMVGPGRAKRSVKSFSQRTHPRQVFFNYNFPLRGQTIPLFFDVEPVSLLSSTADRTSAACAFEVHAVTRVRPKVLLTVDSSWQSHLGYRSANTYWTWSHVSAR